MFGYTPLGGSHIPVLDSDPANPMEGQIWLLRYIELFKDTFTGNDGDALDADSWEVVKTKTVGSVIEHAVTDDVDIRSNMMQFNLRPVEEVADGGAVGMSARMKKFQIDFASEKRTIIWKQQPYTSATPWGLVLEPTIPVEGGDLFSTYKIRVTHNNTKTSLQVMDNSGLFCNVNYLHGAMENDMFEYKLVIDPESNIILYQDGIQKLASSGFPTFASSKFWLYFIYRVPGVPTSSAVIVNEIRNIDDVIIR